tara:strand:+ start:259 stop:489 length:231 start_codon:yes stop_codon:yes gene_type:complete
MKAVVVKELFWLVFGSIISLFLAFIFLAMLNLTSSQETINSIEKVFTVQLYLIGWLVSLISIYIFRIIISAIKKYI